MPALGHDDLVRWTSEAWAHPYLQQILHGAYAQIDAPGGQCAHTMTTDQWPSVQINTDHGAQNTTDIWYLAIYLNNGADEGPAQWVLQDTPLSRLFCQYPTPERLLGADLPQQDADPDTTAFLEQVAAAKNQEAAKRAEIEHIIQTTENEYHDMGNAENEAHVAENRHIQCINRINNMNPFHWKTAIRSLYGLRLMMGNRPKDLNFLTSIAYRHWDDDDFTPTPAQEAWLTDIIDRYVH